MSYTNSFPSRWAIGTFLISLLIVLSLTLAPFEFGTEGSVSFAEIFSYFRHHSSTDDWLANILLFFPLGFSLAAWLWVERAKRSVQFVCVFFCAFTVSITVEVLQVFLPSRTPAFTDIYANSIGGLLGLVCFNRWGQETAFNVFIAIEQVLQRFIQRRIAALPIQMMTCVLIGYAAMLFLVSTSLQNSINFSNWTVPYFLLLGNDQAVGSPWEGYISEFSVADQAISEQEIAQFFAEKSLPESLQNSLVASYDLTAYRSSYADQAGKSPQLIWRGKPTRTTDGSSLVNATQWLESETAASPINQKLRESLEFTLNVVLATANVKQTSPTPIVSLSNQTSDRRNFALAQQGSDLVLWMRTSVNSDDGTRPELIIPNVFSDTDFHQLLITYDGAFLNVCIDGLQNQFSFEFNPGIVLFQRLLPLEDLKNESFVVCKILYYALLFVPLGILTGLALSLSKRRLVYRIVLVAESVLLVPLALEVFLMFGTSRELNLSSFLLGAILTATAILGVLISRTLQGNDRQLRKT